MNSHELAKQLLELPDVVVNILDILEVSHPQIDEVIEVKLMQIIDGGKQSITIHSKSSIKFCRDIGWHS